MHWEQVHLELDDKQIETLETLNAKIFKHLEKQEPLRIQILNDLKNELSRTVNNTPDFVAALKKIENSGDHLALQMLHNNNEILNLPWSMAIDECSGKPLGHLRQLNLIKSLPDYIHPIEGSFETTAPPLKILVMISSPENIDHTHRLSYEDEEFQILSAFEPLYGQYDQALPLYEICLKKIREICDKRGEGTTLNNISQIYKARGDYETALKYLEQSLSTRREIDDKRGEGATLNNISSIYLAMSDYETATKYFEQSLSIQREIGDKRGEGATLNNIGQTFDIRGNYETAIKYFEQSLSIQREIGDKSGQIPTLHNMAMIALDNKDMDLTFEYEGSAYKLAIQTGNAMGLFNVGMHFGVLLFSKGMEEEGIAILKRAVKIGKESQLPGVEEVEQILQNLLSQE